MERQRSPWFAAGAAALLVVFGVCAVVFSFRAVLDDSSGTGTGAAARPSPSHAAAVAAAPKANAPAAGSGSCSPQPCANDGYGWIVRISNLRYGAQAGQYDLLEAGNVFVFVDVTFTNQSDRERHANPTDFVLLDGAGIKHTWSPVLAGCSSWEPVNVTRGATLGPKCLSFQAAAGKPAGLMLAWSPGLIGGGYNIKLT